ncbi:MAG: YigZ family protein [Selenomonas sp.]|uniref:YigZ family protein n=1 Tax=Selenomonas sp. TaxID=2053611 RepID=UPI0025E90A00|nr:YigZ family protein [Selenomonas sp.]MCR5438644.1 YigZ family protein [Selenomonas sp.]
MNPYRTIEETDDSIETLYEIQKSKFITHLRHVDSEDEARTFIQAMKKKYFDARHNCSAYVLGESADKQKSNDDGEPGGTGGNPILEVIRKNDLTNIVVVVTRYFGGIKLGAGGLIRAYSHAAVLGVEAATVLAMTPFIQLDAVVSYDLLATVEHWMRQKEIRSLEADYAENVILHLLIEPANLETVKAALTDLTAGRAALTTGDESLIAIPADS